RRLCSEDPQGHRRNPMQRVCNILHTLTPNPQGCNRRIDHDPDLAVQPEDTMSAGLLLPIAITTRINCLLDCQNELTLQKPCDKLSLFFGVFLCFAGLRTFLFAI